MWTWTWRSARSWSSPRVAEAGAPIALGGAAASTGERAPAPPPLACGPRESATPAVAHSASAAATSATRGVARRLVPGRARAEVSSILV